MHTTRQLITPPAWLSRLAVLGLLALSLGLPATADQLDSNPMVEPLGPPQVLELININTASVEQLTQLDKVGPTRAQAIVDWREQHGPFTSLDQLLAVRGIGSQILALNQARLSL